MLNKFNISALNQYSSSFAQKVCDDFYSQKPVANGRDILNITPIEQVNLFVVSSLYEKWKADAEAFRSPYFDFETSDVKAALQVFMNIVSQNISVKREQLEPLLKDATKNSLVLLFDPQGYFNEILRDQPNFTVTKELATQLQKYTRWSNFVAQEIIKNMGERAFVFVNQAMTSADDAIAQNTDKLEPFEAWKGAYNSIWPLETEAILKKSTLKTEPVIASIIVETAPPPTESFFDSLSATTTAPVIDDTPEVTPQNTEIPMTVVEPMPEVIESPVVEITESLNDHLRTEQESLADNLKRQTMSSITENLTIHQKFMFIHQLFAGSSSNYETAMTELEAAPTYEMARDLIQLKFSKTYIWDVTGDTVGELLELVNRKFGK
jgi:hypothetical protein